jgi:hypothetical protein
VANSNSGKGVIRRRERLGGVLNYYYRGPRSFTSIEYLHTSSGTCVTSYAVTSNSIIGHVATCRWTAMPPSRGLCRDQIRTALLSCPR